MDFNNFTIVRSLSLLLRLSPQFYILALYNEDAAIKLIMLLAFTEILIHGFSFEASNAFIRALNKYYFLSFCFNDRLSIFFVSFTLYALSLPIIIFVFFGLLIPEINLIVFYLIFIASEVILLELSRFFWMSNEPEKATVFDLVRNIFFNVGIIAWLFFTKSYGDLISFMAMSSFLVLNFTAAYLFIIKSISFRYILILLKDLILQKTIFNELKSISFNSYLNNLIIRVQGYFDRLILLKVFGPLFATHFSYVSTIYSMIILVFTYPKIGKLKHLFILDKIKKTNFLNQSAIQMTITAFFTLFFLIGLIYILSMAGLFEQNLFKNFKFSYFSIFIGLTLATFLSISGNTGISWRIVNIIISGILVLLIYISINLILPYEVVSETIVVLLLIATHIAFLGARYFLR